MYRSTLTQASILYARIQNYITEYVNTLVVIMIGGDRLYVLPMVLLVRVYTRLRWAPCV